MINQNMVQQLTSESLLASKDTAIKNGSSIVFRADYGPKGDEKGGQSQITLPDSRAIFPPVIVLMLGDAPMAGELEKVILSSWKNKKKYAIVKVHYCQQPLSPAFSDAVFRSPTTVAHTTVICQNPTSFLPVSLKSSNGLVSTKLGTKRF